MRFNEPAITSSGYSAAPVSSVVPVVALKRRRNRNPVRALAEHGALQSKLGKIASRKSRALANWR